jgi:NAD+ synthase
MCSVSPWSTLRGNNRNTVYAPRNFGKLWPRRTSNNARAALLYYHAELHNYAVVGTPPKNEHGLGFFVKFGDGAMDVKPIAHLYKTQVYQLAEFLEIPEAIRKRPPTSDTYSAGSTQEEFFFRLPFEILDLLWYAWEHQIPVDEVAGEMDLSENQVQHVYQDFARKVQATQYLRTPPLGCLGSDQEPD